MKISLITDLYPIKEDEKFTPRTLFDFVQGWKALGHEVSIIRPNFILNSFVRKKPFYRQGKYGDVLNLNFWLPFVGKIDFKAEKDTLYIAHMPSGILFADKLNLPFIAGVHQSDIDVLTKPLYKWYFGRRLLKALKNSKGIACRSFVLKEKLLKLYPEFEEKTFVCPSGIDEKYIAEFEEKTLNKNEKIKILTAANFKKRKNLDKLIDAVKGLDGFELTVVGDGSERKNLEKLSAGFENIHFTGLLGHEKVLEKMRESDIFVLPSVNETFGMVYLEAMASGCITVGTKGDGIDGIIKNGENGFLTFPISSEIRKLVTSIKEMDDDSLKTLRYNSFRTIQNYTKAGCCEGYLHQILRFCNDLIK